MELISITLIKDTFYIAIYSFFLEKQKMIPIYKWFYKKGLQFFCLSCFCLLLLLKYLFYVYH